VAFKLWNSTTIIRIRSIKQWRSN